MRAGKPLASSPRALCAWPVQQEAVRAAATLHNGQQVAGQPLAPLQQLSDALGSEA